MATLGGTDLGGILKAIQQGVGDLIGGFRPETTNPATAALGQVGKGLDLWDGLQYGSNPTAYTPPASAPMQGYRPPAPQGFGGVGGVGGGLWDGLSFGTGGLGFGVGAGPDLFGGFQQAKQAADQAHQAQQARDQAAAAFGGGQASGGGYGAHEQYRQYIQQYATQYGIDPDALAAILQIESPNADPRAVSPAGAQGLGQFMPGTWAGYGQGGDPFNPEHAIRAAANYFSTLYKQFGRYDLAAAAYQGGPGAIVNGQPRNDINDGNLTPLGYSQAWQANYQRIKSSAPKQGGTATLSPDGFAFPVQGYSGNVELHWGSEHGGADLFAPVGTPVVSLGAGTVVDAGANSLGGNTVTIRLDNGLLVYMAHLRDAPLVRAGQRVNAGQQLGFVGDTGNAQGTGAHLHIGIGYDIISGGGATGGLGSGFDANAWLNAILNQTRGR